MFMASVLVERFVQVLRLLAERRGWMERQVPSVPLEPTAARLASQRGGGAERAPAIRTPDDRQQTIGNHY